MNDNTPTNPIRWFGLAIPDSPISVEVAEYADGRIGVALVTKREGLESLMTTMLLTPSTFALLQYALFRAAHDPHVWREWIDPNKEKEE